MLSGLEGIVEKELSHKKKAHLCYYVSIILLQFPKLSFWAGPNFTSTLAAMSTWLVSFNIVLSHRSTSFGNTTIKYDTLLIIIHQQSMTPLNKPVYMMHKTLDPLTLYFKSRNVSSPQNNSFHCRSNVTELKGIVKLIIMKIGLSKVLSHAKSYISFTVAFPLSHDLF